MASNLASPDSEATPSPAVVRLPDLPPGACTLIEEVESPDDLAQLMAMGVCRGRVLEMVRSGDPLIVRVLGARIGMSARLARQVVVRPCAVAPPPFAPGADHP